MQKYLSAAERIASRAVGGDPLPKPGVFNRRDRVRRLGDGTIQVNDIVEYDAEYIVRVNADRPSRHGRQAGDAGDLGRRQAGQDRERPGADQRGEPAGRRDPARRSRRRGVFLTGGEHTLPRRVRQRRRPRSDPRECAAQHQPQHLSRSAIEIAGPFPPAEPHDRAARRRWSAIPRPAPRCVDRILTTLARRALSPSVDEGRGRAADAASSTSARPRGLHAGAEPAVRDRRDAGLAAVPVPHRARPQARRRRAASPTSSWPRASATSCGARCPTTSCCALAETNKLHQPAVLDAQVKRMIADPKSAALRRQLRRPVAGDAQPRRGQARPQNVPRVERPS